MSTRYRILAVDDNPDMLELIGMTLGEVYDVLTLKNPVEIYDCIELFEPDLLILDIMMPKITGFQLIEILKKNPRTRELPIIVLSAKDNAREIKHGYKLGASLYLTKPFMPERLLKNTETQFRMCPPDGKPKKLTLDQVRIRLEVLQGARTGQIVLSSKLLTESIVRGPKSRPGAETPEDPQLTEEQQRALRGPRWEG